MSAGKRMSLEEAVGKFVQNGDCIAFGGFSTNRRPYAAVREIVRQKKKNLYVETGAAGGDLDLLIGGGCVTAISNSYVGNGTYAMVSRRFRRAVEQGEVLIEDYSLDVQTYLYHAAAMGLPFIAVKNMLGSELVEKWGISQEERKKHRKLPEHKFLIREDPFHPEEKLCLVQTPQIDVACIHVQAAGPDGTCRILGAPFQDEDLAMAAKHTIVTCEELLSEEEIRRDPQNNKIAGLCVDAVACVPFGAHPAQCYGYYDYDSQFLWDFDERSKSNEDFEGLLMQYVYGCPTQNDYLDQFSASRLLSLLVRSEHPFAKGLQRGKRTGGKEEQE